jgi:hypothetical protein
MQCEKLYIAHYVLYLIYSPTVLKISSVTYPEFWRSPAEMRHLVWGMLGVSVLVPFPGTRNPERKSLIRVPVPRNPEHKSAHKGSRS